jgi:hypothetical protein
MALAGVSLDRAAVALLRQIADSEPMRLGELANLLAVEASPTSPGRCSNCRSPVT